MIERVVMFSGGVGSWAAARRTVERHGADGVTLLFADTLIEDPDTYRFLPEAAERLGVPLVSVADGRTPWQVFEDEKFLGNSSLAPCSKILKQQVCRRWMKANAPAATIVMGLDWTEAHRVAGAERGWAPWVVENPLLERPYFAKSELLSQLEEWGVRMPDLYRRGYAHNNCGGLCCRGGQAQWRHVYFDNPEGFATAEAHENGFRERSGKDVAMLKDRTGGRVRPLTLTELRESLIVAPSMFADADWGGCGCFVGDDSDD
jgi:3'-phosphoadenosine 5'-phosphosulfate sulfotransferase (PAPS reductase)/FAD synthetase